MQIEQRAVSCDHPLDENLPPILDKIMRQRGIDNMDELNVSASHLLHFKHLRGIETAANIVANAIVNDMSICIVGDFDADGATSTALCLLAMQDFGHNKTDFIVPNRFDFGYGLTPPVVEMAHTQGAKVIITVDNGISSIEGVALANELGLQVVITDHHLAGEHLPEAAAIVNPNQLGCQFPSKNLAGVGVAFYLMSAVKAALVEQGYFEQKPLSPPNLAKYLDIVALGTVADVVPLDKNNRILVHQGLARIRAGKTRPGILALLAVANRKHQNLSSSDLGFVIGPRLNAAGRLQDMSVGIHCLVTDKYETAQSIALQLDEFNKKRRDIEQSMQTLAESTLQNLALDDSNMPAGISLYDESYHQGVVGIVAGRIKDKYYKPTIAFANENDSTIKGSARSIPGVHIRDILERIHTQNPGLITKFGGHAMAAGMSMPLEQYSTFKYAFEQAVATALEGLPTAKTILSDGSLDSQDMVLDTAKLIKYSYPWGQQFEEPLFDDSFVLIDQRIVGQKHLKLVVKKQEQLFDAIAFNVDTEVWPNSECMRVHLAYRLDINEYRGQVNVQLLVSNIAALD